MTDPGRAKIAADALKEIQAIGKKVGKPATAIASKGSLVSVPTKVDATGISQPVAGTGLLQIFMYTLAGILVIGILLMVVDRWFYPIFKENPGAAGFVLIPGTDQSDQFWTEKKDIKNIIIGTNNTDLNSEIKPLYSNLLEGQASYSITMDILIDDKVFKLDSTDIPDSFKRTFFMIAPRAVNEKKLVAQDFILKVELNRQINQIEIVSITSASLVSIQTALIDNVPVRKPFRIGIVKNQYTLEAYLNGLLVRTIQLKALTRNPNTGGQDFIFAPQNIVGSTATPPTIEGAKILSMGIQVMNLRLFGNSISQSEMYARMNDLTDISNFNALTN